MGLARLSRPSSPKAKPISPTTLDDTRKAFPFLDLPIEIRLMVYEELRAKTYRDNLPLRDAQNYLTLVTTVIPGISILATCHQIRAEASRIILPWLQKIICSPPTIVICAEHIVGLVDLHDGYSSIYGTTLIQRLMSSLHNPRTVDRITRYRQGDLPARQLRRKLHLRELIASEDEPSLHAFLRFVLRAAKYIAKEQDATYSYPPLNVIIEVSDTFYGIPVTTSTSWMKSLSYKCLSPRAPSPPRTMTGHANLSWLLCRLTFHMAFSCDLWSVVSLVVKLKTLNIGHTGWRVGGSSVRRAIVQGLEEARSKRPCSVRYGGRITQEAHEEL